MGVGFCKIIRLIISSEMKRTLITSALPYANGPLHIGHMAGAYLPADIYFRFLRLRGEEAIHISGTDEHGVAITIAAEQRGMSPRQLVDHYHEVIAQGFRKWGIEFTNFSRTSREIHHRTAQEFFLKLYEKGWFREAESEQYYCPKCKRFLPDRYVVGTCPYCGYERARGDQCERCGRWLEPKDLINPRCAICGATPVLRRTRHFYFKLSELRDRLIDWLQKNEFWKPNVRNTALGWAKEGLPDRAITRDLEWGVKVPLKGWENKVLYVWFDAPIGYISATREWSDSWRDWWQDPETRIIHFIGKDNIVFHALVWPGMLMAHGEFNLPYDVPANEFLNLMGDKLSTSRGWAVWADELVDEFGQDYARYGTALVIPETKDSDFNWHEFRKRVNGELADAFGNFVHRFAKFAGKHFGGKWPEEEVDSEVLTKVQETHAAVTRALERYQFRKALSALHALAIFGNQYFDRKAPWKDPKGSGKTIYSCAFLARALAVMYEPFIPQGARRVREILGITEELSWDEAARDDGSLRGRQLGEVKPPFKKIEEAQVQKKVDELMERAQKREEPEYATLEDLKKLGLVVGVIEEAEPIEGTKKLLKLKVNIGREARQLVAGLAEVYSPERLLGKKVIIVSNLQPKKIKGVESQGMLLAADDPEGKPVLLTLEDPDRVEPGSEVH